MVNRCECCLGRKTLVGLGNMVVKCSFCKGVGYVADAEIPEREEEAVVIDIPKKMGRPPKHHIYNDRKT